VADLATIGVAETPNPRVMACGKAAATGRSEKAKLRRMMIDRFVELYSIYVIDTNSELIGVFEELHDYIFAVAFWKKIEIKL
jgi:hypothetical protein